VIFSLHDLLHGGLQTQPNAVNANGVPYGKALKTLAGRGIRRD